MRDRTPTTQEHWERYVDELAAQLDSVRLENERLLLALASKTQTGYPEWMRIHDAVVRYRARWEAVRSLAKAISNRAKNGPGFCRGAWGAWAECHPNLAREIEESV